MSELREYLEKMAKFNRIADWVLKHGQDFAERVKPIRKGRMKECFSNAANLALDHQDLTYCEGYGYTEDLIPLPHAWTITPEGKVMDTTWTNEYHRKTIYYGVLFPTEFLREYLLKSKYYGIIDDWHNGWPLLNGETNFELIKKI